MANSKPIKATAAPKFTVSMHPKLVDELDEGFGPTDGLIAIDEMFGVTERLKTSHF